MIQLCKLFSPKDSQMHNFEKLLKQLESTTLPVPKHIESAPFEDYWIDNRDKLSSLISKIRGLLNDQQEKISNITLLRDSIYAHKDKKIKGDFAPWPDLKILSDLALEIYNEIQLGFFGTTFLFPNKESWSPKWVVFQASKSRPIGKSKDE